MASIDGQCAAPKKLLESTDAGMRGEIWISLCGPNDRGEVGLSGNRGIGIRHS